MSDAAIPSLPHCSFCGVEQSPATSLIAGAEGAICEACVKLADQVVTNWGRKRILGELHGPIPKPAKIKEILDAYVIGQHLAAVAQRWVVRSIKPFQQPLPLKRGVVAPRLAAP